MTAFALDGGGEARLALQDIFRDFGPAGIDDGELVDRHLPDLLPDSPREASLLRAAAAAKAGQLLTDRLGAGIPADAAVRDVAAILAGRLAFDLHACLWVVSEYARVLGHPTDVDALLATVNAAPPRSPETNGGRHTVVGAPSDSDDVADAGDAADSAKAAHKHAAGGVETADGAARAAEAGPVNAGPANAGAGSTAAGPAPGAGAATGTGNAGRAGMNAPTTAGQANAGSVYGDARAGANQAGFVPVRDPWQTAPLPTVPAPAYSPGRAGSGGTMHEQMSGAMRTRDGGRRKSRTPIVVGVVVLVMVLAGAAVALSLHRSPKCTGTGCAAAGSIGPSVASTVSTSQAPSSSATSSPTPSTPSSPGLRPDLAGVMPLDVEVATDKCTTKDSFLADVTAYYYCDLSGTGFALTGTTRVWAYQFANQTDLATALVQFNKNVMFDPSRAAGGCPPTDNQGGTGSWYRDSQKNPLGALECYTANRGGVISHDYVWTSPHDLTIMLCETTDTFPHLESWWEKNNDNDNGQVD